MPAKYSHVKKRPPPKKSHNASNAPANSQSRPDRRNPGSTVDRSPSRTGTDVSKLERTVARIVLLRFEQDMARLFSTHLYYVALVHLPTFVLRCAALGGPSWVAANADCDEIKDFFRTAIAMDMRQAGERVATKSVLWTYTALRHFVCTLIVPSSTSPVPPPRFPPPMSPELHRREDFHGVYGTERLRSLYIDAVPLSTP